MKLCFFMLVSVLLVTACSSPKYSYNFDHYDYNSGRKNSQTNSVTELTTTKAIVKEESPLILDSDQMVASADAVTPAPTVAKKYSDMTRSEKKEVRKVVKNEIKKILKAKKADGNIGKETKVLDYNLKMAIIFGSIALILSFLGGITPAFWIASVIALVIGVVFFIKWIAEQ